MDPRLRGDDCLNFLARSDHAPRRRRAARASYDGKMAEAGFIPLSRAAALLYGRLFPGESVKETKTLDLLALVLSAQIPLYQGNVENGVLHALEPSDVARGRFARGATRLEFSNREPLRFLLVSRAELYAAIDAISKDPTSPVWRMCRPTSHPQPPAHSSAKGA
jgi:hypothetical protein